MQNLLHLHPKSIQAGGFGKASPPLVRPGTNLKIPVKLGGLNPGEDAKIVVAAVDVGILNLTNYKPPAPDNYYLGQRQLTAEIHYLTPSRHKINCAARPEA